MNKWDKLYKKIEGVMDGNDIRINDCLTTIPIPHQKIQQLQIQNAELYKVKCYMEFCEEEESK